MGKIKKGLSKFWNLITRHKIPSIIILIVLAILVFIFFPKNQKPILTETAKKQDVIQTVSVTGNIAAQTTANLTFQTAETLSYVGVSLGDYVNKGQAIVSLNQTQLQASLRQSQQDFVAAKAASQQYYDNNTSGTESDVQKVQRTAIDAMQNKAYDQMLKVQHDIANSTLYSPIAGIVTRMDAQTVGVNVTPATVFTVIDPSSLDFNMEVDEADIGKVTLGQNINVSLDAFPDNNLKLSVTKIDFVNHTTSSGGNAFYVQALLPQPNNYRVGMSGNADIIINAEYNVLAIQSTDIFDNNYVYVKTPKGFTKTKLDLGLQNDTQAQVLSGLSEGDTVAIDPTSVPQNLVGKN
jgi:RND family efflux transporter MFP subunit